ncbi:hypothetical protein CYMTET_28485 [Cymbomonas tetramitiformis]|uniref:Uncharacterized protein n=1 Tax=Cymbomonas tetramitiformis TaxID=36881 RepID=A0AAE0FN30_9CHLO|nr:hypothetical protein CYMTET_28485 [Cymbomonas tetramitiformis]
MHIEFPKIRLNHTSPGWHQVQGAFSESRFAIVDFNNLTYGYKKEVSLQENTAAFWFHGQRFLPCTGSV